MSGLSTADDLKGLIHGTKFTLSGGTVWETSHEYPGIIMVSLMEPHRCDHLTLLATPDWSGEEELHVYLEHSETGVRPDIEDDLFKDLFVDDPDVDVGRWQMAVLGYLKKHEAEVLAHCGASRATAPGALDAINRHRRKMGQSELDPTASGWSAQDVEIEAARIARLNPAQLDLKRRLMR